MGFADFPVEILRALKIKPSENNDQEEGIISSPSCCNGDELIMYLLAKQ